MDEYEFRRKRSANDSNKSPGPIHDYEQYMYGGNVGRDRIEENSPNATIEELDEDDEQILDLVGIDEKQELTPEDEREINQVFHRGIPAAIVGTYGTTLGTKVIWQSFAKVIVQRFGVVAAQALGLSAADGLLPVGEAIALGLLAVTAWQIARNWDELWRDAEKILVTQEPEPQIYTTPTDEQVETPRNTGHAPPEVETGTPPFDTESGTQTPTHTGGHTTKQPSAGDFVMEANTGLSDRAQRAIEKLENIKYDPLGDINSRTNHNHYDAARREARGEVVARKQNGDPFSHISDLQQAYNGLQNVRRDLEAERDNPPNTITPRGEQILKDRIPECQNLLSNLKGFLSQIGHAPPFPPFHTWPPGT